MKTIPPRDPIRANQRRAVAARRVGEKARCACGEARPEALIAGSNPVICAQGRRQEQGKCIMDKHHVAGKANSPITITVPVNDHRARLSPNQYDWPKPTLENPNASQLLAAAASIRGFIDTNLYLSEKLLEGVPELLEQLAELKTAKAKA